MKRAGLGGVTMFDVAQPGIPAGPHAYMGKSWQEMFAWEIREAKRLGLEVMSQNGPGYSGNGGPWITPEFASQKIVESATRIQGGERFSGNLPQPATQGGFYRDVAVLAIRETESPGGIPHRGLRHEAPRLAELHPLERHPQRAARMPRPRRSRASRWKTSSISSAMKPDGSITWDAPAGEWTLLRFGHTWTGQKTLPATPEGEGPECDKLDKRGIRTHFDHVMKRMVELAGPTPARPSTPSSSIAGRPAARTGRRKCRRNSSAAAATTSFPICPF